MLPGLNNLAANGFNPCPLKPGHFVEPSRALRKPESKAGIHAGLHASGYQSDQSLVVGVRHRSSLVVLQP